MNGKVDYKKDYKPFYMPRTTPEIEEVPKMPFFTVGGSGDPNRPAFVEETSALYSLSYAVKMSYKSDDVPAGYYEYTVFPLEGIWDLLDRSKPATDKSNLKYKIMIRQPDFLTELTTSLKVLREWRRFARSRDLFVPATFIGKSTCRIPAKSSRLG